ncbi:MAG: flagellar basal body rod protein FlgC [Pseudomonadota bacterium]
MSLFKNFDVAGSAMSAQSARLNLTASNMANATTIAGSPDEAYRSRHPVFQSIYDEATNGSAVSVQMIGVVEDQRQPLAQFQPGHPLADEQGFVYAPNVNVVEEMVNMMSASRSFQSNVEIVNTTRQMLQRTLTMGE